MYAVVGETFENTLQLTPSGAMEFARLAGDANPLHFDQAFAEQTRFQGLIACGPQYASQFMGLAATYFTAKGLAVGLEFSFKFKLAVRQNDTLRFRWEVTEVVWNEKLGGDLISLSGRITNAAGIEVLTSVGKLLVAPRP